MKNIVTILENLSDNDLFIIQSEITQLSIPNDALVRKVLLDVYGKSDTFFQNLQTLVWHLFNESIKRLKIKSVN